MVHWERMQHPLTSGASGHRCRYHNDLNRTHVFPSPADLVVDDHRHTLLTYHLGSNLFINRGTTFVFTSRHNSRLHFQCV